MAPPPRNRRIRIRHPAGSTTIDLLSNDNNKTCTAGDVARRIEETVNIPASQQEWRSGFPPRPYPSKLRADEALPADLDMIQVSKVDVGSVTVDFTTAETANGATSSSALNLVDDSSIEEPPLTDPEGYIIRRVVDADNSCLFNSIGYALFQKSRSHAPQLRKMIADAVLADPMTYTDAFVGRPAAEYAEWIQKETSWGGQIDLSIFSRLFKTEIAAFDVIRNREDVYGTEEKYKRRIMVMYDGIHYDALAYCYDPSLPEAMDVTQFSPADEGVMDKARKLCAEQHQAKEFTDTSNFTLRCLVCQEGLVGQMGAAEHAEQTGHANFAEFQ